MIGGGKDNSLVGEKKLRSNVSQRKRQKVFARPGINRLGATTAPAGAYEGSEGYKWEKGGVPSK